MGGSIDGDNRVCYNTLENAERVNSMVQYHRAVMCGKSMVQYHRFCDTLQENLLYLWYCKVMPCDYYRNIFQYYRIFL